MSVEHGFVDTNVLVASVFPEHEHHDGARRLFERVLAGEVEAWLSPQILTEVFAVVTNGRRVGVPRSCEEALRAIEAFLGLPGLVVAPMPIDFVERLVHLLRARPTSGASVFDYQIAAVMLGNGLTRIYTNNGKDFEWLDGVEVVAPR